MNPSASNLDIEKFRKVHRLMSGGATAGEREAARARAEAMAAKAGMSLKQALSSLDKPKVHTFNFADAMEKAHPGWTAAETAKRSARKIREDRLRADVLKQYGSRANLFARIEREELLEEAIEPRVSAWEHWTDEDNVRQIDAKVIDGVQGRGGWIFERITSWTRDAVTRAYPWPSSLAGVLAEVTFWDQLWYDRTLFLEGEWVHRPEVECRIEVLKHALTRGQAAESWDDVQARFDWKRYEYRSQWVDPHDPVDPFMDRLEADVAALRRAHPAPASPPTSGPRTNAEKRDAVLSMLDASPDLSDREIARRVGVSPQTVNTWRKRRRSE